MGKSAVNGGPKRRSNGKDMPKGGHTCRSDILWSLFVDKTLHRTNSEPSLSARRSRFLSVPKDLYGMLAQPEGCLWLIYRLIIPN